MAHALLASATVVHTKSGGICLLTVTCFQIKLACNIDLLTCSKSAAWVSEIFSDERLPMKNTLYLASLTDKEANVLLYIYATNRPMRSICTLFRVKHSGSLVKAIDVSARSILPCIPATLLTTAQNVGGYITIC